MITPADINPQKVAVYIRWSTDDQGEGTTLETQLERCKYYLVSQGWTFNEQLVYIDDGYSGGSLDRPALKKLREDVEAGKIQCVVVYKIDRLSRSVVDIVDLVLREWEGRCFIKSTSEDVNTISPAGKMFFYILVSFAEYERSVIKERTMGGKVKRAEQGLNPGFRPPYGYVKGATPGSFVVVEHEAGSVRRIFDMYLKGNGSYQIAHLLNSEGLRRRENLWNQIMIRRVLTNPAYIGILEYGKSMRTTKEQRERHGMRNYVHFEKPRYAVVENAYPPLVDRAVWDQVQKLHNARSTQWKGSLTKPTYSDYLLSGLATCRCGAPINGKRVGQHSYYHCSARKRQGSSVCDAGHIATGPVDVEVEQRVKALLSVEAQKRILSVIEDDIRHRGAEIQGALAQAAGRLKALDERAQRLERDYRDGELPARLYTKELGVLETEREQTDERIRSLQEQLDRMEGARHQREALLETISQVSVWDDLNVPERKQLLQKLTDCITLYRAAHSSEAPVLGIDWIRL